MIKYISILLILPCLTIAAPSVNTPEPITVTGLQVVYEGPYLSFYTSGRMLRQHRHPKSGVWNTPARKMQEMWVKKTGDSEIQRLNPRTYRSQLIALLYDFPEVHGAIHHRSFTYKKLAEEAPRLNRHIEKVFAIRKERESFWAK